MFFCRNWLVGFLLGSICALFWCFGPGRDFWGLVLCVLLSLGALSKHASSVCVQNVGFAVGFLWAVIHNAPSPKEFVQSPEMFHANLWASPDLGALIHKQGRYYYARGFAEQGTRGYLKERGHDFFRKKEFAFKPYDTSQDSAHIVARNSRALQNYFSHLSQEINGSQLLLSWLDGIYFGKPFRDLEVMNDFRDTGLIHLLVVSGMHIVFIGLIVNFCVGVPVQIFYILGKIGPQWWVIFQIVKFLLTSLVMIFYLIGIGIPQAGQRAIFTYIVLRFKGLGGIPWKHSDALGVAATAQSILFPIGFLNSSNLLSWSIYLVVLGQFYELTNSLGSGSWKKYLSTLFQHQLELMLLSSVVIGKVSLSGVFANIFLVPVFSFIFFAGLIFFVPFFNGGWIYSFVESMHMSFLELVSLLARLGREVPGNTLELQGLPFIIKFLWVIGAGCVVLYRLRSNRV